MEIKKLFFSFLLVFILSFQIGFSQENTLKYLYFFQDDNSESNKIAYEIKITDDLKAQDKLKVNLFFNNESKGNICLQELNSEDNTYYSKIICEVPKLGNGDYEFVAEIDGINVKESITNNEYVFENNTAKTSFIDNLDNTTTVVIDVEGNGENLVIYNKIPKEVISLITKDIKNDLIKSELNFDIIEEDPLIAWNIEKAPTKINYTINKQISNDDRKNFKVILKNDNNFMLLKYFIFLLIFVIIILIILPILKKKKNNS